MVILPIQNCVLRIAFAMLTSLRSEAAKDDQFLSSSFDLFLLNFFFLAPEGGVPPPGEAPRAGSRSDRRVDRGGLRNGLRRGGFEGNWATFGPLFFTPTGDFFRHFLAKSGSGISRKSQIWDPDFHPENPQISTQIFLKISTPDFAQKSPLQILPKNRHSRFCPKIDTIGPDPIAFFSQKRIFHKTRFVQNAFYTKRVLLKTRF